MVQRHAVEKHRQSGQQGRQGPSVRAEASIDIWIAHYASSSPDQSKKQWRETKTISRSFQARSSALVARWRSCGRGSTDMDAKDKLVRLDRARWRTLAVVPERSCQFTLQCGTSMPLIFKEKAETEMYALGIPIETAARVLGAQYETHRPVDRPPHKATLRHLFERITRLAMLFHLRLKACRVSFELTEFAPICPSPALKCKSTPVYPADNPDP